MKTKVIQIVTVRLTGSEVTIVVAALMRSKISGSKKLAEKITRGIK